MKPSLPPYLVGPPETRTARFFEHWLGPPTSALERVGEQADVDFPDVLRRHYETRSRWDVPLNRVCRLLHPSDVGVGEIRPPEITVVLEEEQGVQEWGFDADRQAWTRETEEGEPWVPVGADLGSFLLGYELAEAATATLPCAAFAACSWAERRRVEEAIEPLAALPVPPFLVGYAPHHHYGNDDVLALVGPNPAGGETPETATGWEIWVSGRRAGALDWLADLGGVVHGEGWESRTQLDSYDGIVWDTLRPT